MTVKSRAAATRQKTKDHDSEDDTAVEARIYQSIFDGVLDHRLTPGTKLPEPQLCQLFGVGRAVVRRVLEKLAYDGIVVLRPNKGAVIAAPTPEETREIFEARRALERTLVELAVEHHPEAIGTRDQALDQLVNARQGLSVGNVGRDLRQRPVIVRKKNDLMIHG